MHHTDIVHTLMVVIERNALLADHTKAGCTVNDFKKRNYKYFLLFVTSLTVWILTGSCMSFTGGGRETGNTSLDPSYM